MNPQVRDYYVSRRNDILDLYGVHSGAWMPFLVDRYGQTFAEAVVQDARGNLEDLISDLPYIGGDENPMTRHIIRCSTSLALYLTMKARGASAEEVGNVIYDAVVESVRHLPPNEPLTEAQLAEKRARAIKSQAREYPGDWVRVFVEGRDGEFAYGYDFHECGTQKLYHARDADEFLPYFCYLDFVTYRTPGWSFARTKTLAEGHELCNFRFKKGGATQKGWPPPFVQYRSVT